MGICDSRSSKKSLTQFQSSPTVCITPILKQQNKKKKQNKIRFCDAETRQQQKLSDNRSNSPPPRLCFHSNSSSSNTEILFGQVKASKVRLNQIISPVQSKQTLFGKTLRFQNQSKRGQREGFKDSPQKQ